MFFNLLFGEFLQPLLFYSPFHKYWLFSALAWSLLMGYITAVITDRQPLAIAIVLFTLISPTAAVITMSTFSILGLKCGYWWVPDQEPSPSQGRFCGVMHQAGG
jgi:hypothetical protein